jgi:hypothetical protein
MIRSSRFICVLDTNVIYPVEVRDILLWFAHHRLYVPKWTADINREWAAVMKRHGVDEREITKRCDKMNEAFPFALVENYESLIEKLELPDKDDRHVLAAAIKVNASQIVTNNLKDFPEGYLASFGLVAKSADDFLADIIDLDHETSLAAFQNLVIHRRNPEMDEYEVLDAMRRNGLNDTANYLHSLI